MIKITADSTCDLGISVGTRGIGIMPLSVILGETAYRDGVDIRPQDIFDYVERSGQLPKTAAPSIGEYADFFRPYVEILLFISVFPQKHPHPAPMRRRQRKHSREKFM